VEAGMQKNPAETEMNGGRGVCTREDE